MNKTGSKTSDRVKVQKNLRALIESALLIATSFVLSYITLLKLPQGGSVTPLSMLPLLTIGLRHGPKWGLCGGFVYACLQMLQDFWPPPSGTAVAYISVILLDYIIAFTVLGFSGLFRGRRFGAVFVAPFCLFLRFLSHFASGILIWSYYAEGTPAWLYSLIYNGSYMGIELVFTTIVCIVLCKTAPVIFKPQ